MALKKLDEIKDQYNNLYEVYLNLLKKHNLEQYNYHINYKNKYINDNNENKKEEEEEGITDLKKKLDDLKIDNQVLHCSLYDFNKRFIKTLYKFEKHNYKFIMNEKNDDLNDEETKKLDEIFNNT